MQDTRQADGGVNRKQAFIYESLNWEYTKLGNAEAREHRDVDSDICSHKCRGIMRKQTTSGSATESNHRRQDQKVKLNTKHETQMTNKVKEGTAEHGDGNANLNPHVLRKYTCMNNPKT